MVLSRTARTWIIVLSIPVFLLMLGIVAVKIYFTSERLQTLILPRIEEATHRKVTVSEISVSIFPSFAVSIDDLKITNPEPSPFEHKEFLSLDNLKLKVNLFALVGNKLEIDYVIVDHPAMYLEITHDGLKNYSNNESTTTTNVTVEKNNAGELLLSNLEINDGELEYVDKKYGSRCLIKGLHHAASVESTLGENKLVLNGTTSIDKFSYGTLTSLFLIEQPVAAESKLMYKIDTDMLSLDAVNIKLRELPLTIGGTISHVTQKTLLLDLTVTTQGVQLDQLLSIVPPAMLKKTKGLTSSGGVKFTMSMKGESNETMNPGVSGSFTITNGNIQYASLPKSISNINLTGSFVKPSAPAGAEGIGNFSIERMTATLGSNDLGGNMSLTNFNDPDFNASFNGTLNLSEVKEYYPLETGTEVNGAMKMNVAFNGKVKSPGNIKARGTAEFKNATITTAASTTPLRNLTGTVTFNNQVLESNQLTMNIGESDLNLAFTMKNYLGMMMSDAARSVGKPAMSMTLRSEQLRTMDMLSEEQPHEGAATTTAAKPKGGLFPGFDIDAQVAIDKLVTEKFTFENARGALTISNGVINLKNMSVNAFQGMIRTTGTLDLRETNKRPFNLDLDINNVESNALLSNFTSFGKYLFGKFSTTTRLQGDLNDTLGLRTTSLQGDGVVQIFEGRLLGFPLMQKLSDVTHIAELREVNFKNWTNTFSISNGRLNVKGLKVNAGSADFLMDGSQGLEGSMDYHLTVKLPEALADRLKLGDAADQLLQFFKDKDGRINLAFNVSGTQSSPVVALDVKAQENAMKAALQQKSDEAKKKLEGDLKKKVEEGLKKLFKRP